MFAPGNIGIFPIPGGQMLSPRLQDVFTPCLEGQTGKLPAVKLIAM
jgi:hypothetical protein